MRNVVSLLYSKICHSVKYPLERYHIIQKLSVRKQRSFILFGSPTHGNLGDHAISLAEIEFLQRNFADIDIFEITNHQFMSNPYAFQQVIRNDDVLMITGGGFLGDLWPNEESFVRCVIRHFPNNNIIVLPQTTYYYCLENETEAKKFYSKFNNIFLFARENNSYEIFNRIYYAERVFRAPDMVLSMHPSISTMKRNGILFCMREDKERIYNDVFVQDISNRFKQFGLCVSYTSTVETREISFVQRKKHVCSKLNEFASAQLVVTDRLHGMMFSALTNTPCIALDNLSHKVSGVYTWIHDIPYIQCIHNISEFDKTFESCCKLKLDNYNFKPIEECYVPLVAVIKNCLEECREGSFEY